MASKGSIFTGLLERVVLKALSRLTYDTAGNLRVTNTPTGTQPVSGTVTATVATAGTVAPVGSTVTASSQAISLQIMQQSFRRNLTVT